jgi:ABC-type polysaccharide/polyol phosphate export permease
VSRVVHSDVVWERIRLLWTRRELVISLTRRDLQTRYKGSVVGIVWSVLHPLLLAGIYTVAVRFVLRIQIPNYAIFVLSGLLPWMFFTSSLTIASLSIVNQGQLVKKIAFPREALPIAAVSGQLVHFTIAYLVVVPAMAWLQIGVSPALLALPVLMLLLAVFTGGLALLIAAAQVYFRDTRHLLDVLLQLWFWVTPIIYSMELVPERFRSLFDLNPLVPFLRAFRTVVLGFQLPSGADASLLATMAVLVMSIGYAGFQRAQRRFAEFV